MSNRLFFSEAADGLQQAKAVVDDLAKRRRKVHRWMWALVGPCLFFFMLALVTAQSSEEFIHLWSIFLIVSCCLLFLPAFCMVMVFALMAAHELYVRRQFDVIQKAAREAKEQEDEWSS